MIKFHSVWHIKKHFYSYSNILNHIIYVKLKNESGEEGEYNEYSSNHKAKVGVSLLAIILSDGLENLRFGYPQLQSLCF